MTDIGMNVSESQVIMDILMEADAIDFENETAILIPLKREYTDRCLQQVPRLAIRPEIRDSTRLAPERPRRF